MPSVGKERGKEVRRQATGNGKGREMRKDVKIEGTNSRIC
jgi:hypothetical protein